MKKALLLQLVLMLLYTASLWGQTTFTMNINSGGIDRTFRLYVPAAYTGQEPRPLVFQFHGSGSTSTLDFQNRTNFTDVADTANFILVTPQGTLFPQWGWTDWNAYETVSNGVDDVLFVSDMIDTLAKNYNIDTTRIYTSGWSAGAFFSYYLGWKLSNRIAAAGGVCGGFEQTVYGNIMPTRPFSVMEIHGTNDPIVPLEGISADGLVIVPLDDLMNYWVDYNDCMPVPTVTDMPNTDLWDGCTTKRYTWANGDCGTEVQLLKITGGRHTWPGWNAVTGGTCRDFYADVELWRFFIRHPLGCAASSAVEPKSVPDMAVWPNPASDYLRINTEKLVADALLLVDSYGHIRLRRALDRVEHGGTTTLDLRHLSSGVYFLVAETEGMRQVVRRVVVVR